LQTNNTSPTVGQCRIVRSIRGFTVNLRDAQRKTMQTQSSGLKRVKWTGLHLCSAI